MTRRTAALFAALTLGALASGEPALAQDATQGDVAADISLDIVDAADVSLDEFLWIRRPVVIFADTPADPRFAEQLQLLTSRPTGLVERDVVVIVDADPDARSDVRRQLRPRGFQITLIGKDGEVELRKPSPWSSRELSRSIDKMPLRQQEVRERKAAAG